MKTPSKPPRRDLVLVGGGHSHVQVLKSFGMAPLDGVRVTVVAREVHTPYSGMLPGYVAGFHRWNDIHIDLGPLCRFAGARLLADEVSGLDLDAGWVHCAQRPPIRFDLLSINCGAAPEAPVELGVRVKPIGRFLPEWDKLRDGIRPNAKLVLVGGGAGGLELALAARRALPESTDIKVVADDILPGHGFLAKRLLLGELAKADIALVRGQVASGSPQALRLRDGAELAFDHLFWVTGVRAPSWVADSGLATDDRGFVRVNANLRSVSHERVYAAGDIAHLEGGGRPKSGVYAVRAGPALATNLRRFLAGRSARPFRLQRRALSLVGTGNGRAVASRGALAVSGRWAWHWKRRIDRRFMRRYQALPSMDEAALEQGDGLDAMRCGGCGAKIGAGVLNRVLSRLPVQSGPHLLQGIGDDAALLASNPAPLALTIDGFRSLVDDPHQFGRLTAHHCLNDIYAMGAVPTGALALATVPLMSEALMEDELHQMLLGAVQVLNADAVPLVGGHSAEGAELSLGLAISGAAVDPPLGKGDAQPGDRLILTKPLGIGVLLAAHMRGMAPTAQVHDALRRLDRSNADALALLRRHGVRAATDVTGFGLIGHLAEMLDASGLGAELWLDGLPVLDGSMDAFERGAASVLQPENERVLSRFELRGCLPADPAVRLLADPQTAGGLLACVPDAEAPTCLQALRNAGYADSACIGIMAEGASSISHGTHRAEVADHG
ncbi:MAG: selenide, water dikinase SelD [Gammaproteobacteria bacterium]|nr:selenide, water dikinase SelD [Gammaproteobacteria bacterium]